MSTVTLSPEVVQSLKQQMKEIWMEVLPEILPGIIKETTPILAEVIKEITPIVVKASAEQLRDENVLKQQHDRKFEEFKLRHKKTLDEHLNKRTGMYKKFLSFDWHIQLYEQYLAENSYVPRKYRLDDYHVNNEAELERLKTMEKERLRGECEISKLRRDFFLHEVTKEDEQVQKVIKDQNLPKEVEAIAIERWQKVSQEYMKAAETEEESKKRSTIEAHKKDEAIYRAKLVERLKTQTGSSEEEVRRNQSTEDSGLTSSTSSSSVGTKGKNELMPKFQLVVTDAGAEGPPPPPAAPPKLSREEESRLVPDVELVVTDDPNSPNGNMVDMSLLEPLPISEVRNDSTGGGTPTVTQGESASSKNGSKNLMETEILRRSQRISSTSPANT